MFSRFRFTLGQLMGVIALSALLMASAVFASQGNFTFYSLAVAAIECVGVGVLLYNRRLSRWIWALIAGHAGPLLMWPVQVLSPLFPGFAFFAVQTTLFLACSVLFVVGLAMTFRDIRRRLAFYESAP
jgi:hypothetical protein